MLELIIHYLETFNLISLTFRLVISVLLGGMIGFSRAKKGQAAGLKTHVLVGLGAALSAIIGLYTTEILGYNNDPLRIGAQVVSGIGFLGVGTILVVGKSHIKGLTTAAGLWVTACIGLACGVGFISIALISTIIVVITVTLVNRFEIIKSLNINHIYFFCELNDVTKVNEFVDEIRSNYNVFELRISNTKSNLVGNVGIQIVISDLNDNQIQEFINNYKKDYVTYLIESY